MPIKVSVTLPEVVDLLQRLIEADPVIAKRLMLDVVPCSPAVAQVAGLQLYAPPGGQPHIGLMGLFNALFGVDEATGMPAISVFALTACSTNPQHELRPGQRLGDPCVVAGCDGHVTLSWPTAAGVTPAGLAALKAVAAEIRVLDHTGAPVDDPDGDPPKGDA